MTDETENKFDPQRDIPLLQQQIVMLSGDLREAKEAIAVLDERVMELLHRPTPQPKRAAETMERDIARLEKQMMGLLKPEPKEPETKYTLQHLRENWLAAERRADDEEKASMESGGILSDVCDIAFEDEMRAGAEGGYEGIKDRVTELVSWKHRWAELRKQLTTDGATSVLQVMYDIETES